VSDKKSKRWIVECVMETMGGTRASMSKPLMRAQADALVSSLRDAGITSSMHQREYSEDELEQAEELAAMGKEAPHIGTPVV
jgi:hypothetical protein